ADAIAIIFGSEHLTYGELNVRANHLAHGLLDSGAKPGQCVAMLLERGFDQIVAALAILKTGCAYIPFDSGLPLERIIQMLGDAGASLMICHSGMENRFQGLENTKLVLLDKLASVSEANPGIECGPEALAYVMFTSGSTGRPKGVEVPHRGIVRLVRSADYMPLNEETVLLQMASISFDVSTFEIWGPLLNGGTCVLCPAKVPTLELIRQLLAENWVNTFLTTAAFFNLIVKEDSSILSPLNYLMVGGEALSAWHIEKALRELPGVCLMNGYGPTENSVNSTVYIFDRECFDATKPIPIGRSVVNSSCYILDRFQRPVGIGVPGELYVGGDGVARGYAGRPDLTKERFAADPFSTAPNARMYKTGDLAYWNSEGLIEFIGRVDNQIKLRGFRMELQEIEVTLGEYPGVEQVVVNIYEDDVRGKWLAGFAKVDDPETFSVDGLRKFGLSRLPEYMVPSVLVPVKEWGFTPNGKIDRKALPKPMLNEPCVEVSYASETEEGLAEIWRELLGIKTVPRENNFFELGGDSLRALTMFQKINQRFGRDFTLATLLKASTVAMLAQEIESAEDDGLSGFRSLKLIQKGDDKLPPLFWMHGGDGQVLIFKHFAEHFGPEQPMYAFQWAGLDGGRGEATVEEMAQAYMKELLAFHPSGPVRIGGYCIGGYVAMELARLLRLAGIEVVGPLVVVGSPNIRAKSFDRREPESSNKTQTAFERMCAEMIEHRIVGDAEIPWNYVRPELPPGLRGTLIQTRLYAAARRWRTMARLAKISKSAEAGTPVPQEERQWYCGQTAVMAGERHNSRGYAGDMVYFRSGVCHGAAMGSYGWWDDLYMGFGEWCRGHFEGIVVGGPHEEVLKRPEVAQIVRNRFGFDE
ncbi:MAG: amino acid adenylation domain-containing protein, partial [Kiritimatiellaceae bacterium]|nr:amino acid adenylation domain-containing protein [Kiritimatiellaceae bacterium]